MAVLEFGVGEFGVDEFLGDPIGAGAGGTPRTNRGQQLLIPARSIVASLLLLLIKWMVR